MKTKLVTGPSYYPITLSEAKAQARILHSDEDAYLNGLIVSATSWAEGFCSRRFVYQTVRAYLDCWPEENYLKLPYGSLVSVSHIKYTDSDGGVNTWDASEYIVDNTSDPGLVVLCYGESWPTGTLYPSNPIEIQFVCGGHMGPAWSDSESKAAGDVVVPTTYNEFAYTATIGTTDATEPVLWPREVGATVADNDITWTCVASVSEGIRHAIKVMVTESYKLREPFIIGTVHKSLPTAERLLWPHKIHGVWL